MNEPTLVVAGNLVSDVEFRLTARGDAMARFRVASTAKLLSEASFSPGNPVAVIL